MYKAARKIDIVKPSGKICSKCLLAALTTMAPLQVYRTCFVDLESPHSKLMFRKISRGDTRRRGV